MKKVFWFLLFIPLYLFTSAFSFKEWKNSLYQQIKIQAEQNLSIFLQSKVSVKKSSGLVVGQIILHQTQIPKLGEIQKLEIYFNPFQYLISRGNLINSLQKIIIEDGTFKIKRDKEGKFNLEKFFRSSETKEPPPRLNLVFKNCILNYSDPSGSLTLSSLQGEVKLPAFKGKFHFPAGKGNYLGYQLDQLQGQLFLRGNQFILTPSLNLEGPLAKGKLQGRLNILSLQPHPTISGKIRFLEGDFLQQKFQGEVKVDYQQSRLYLKGENLSFYQGLTTFTGEVNFISPHPHLSLGLKFKEIDLARLIPGVKILAGKAQGSAQLEGKTDDLQGNFFAQLSSATLLGIPLETTQGIFDLRQGKIALRDFRMSSSMFSFFSSGEVYPRPLLSLEGKIAAINFTGKTGLNLPTEIKLFSQNSGVEISGEIHANQALNLRLKGNFDLEDLKNLTEKYHQIKGKAKIDLSLSGSRLKPQIFSAVTIENFRFNEIYLEVISGEVSYQENFLTFSPLDFRQKNNTYSLNGDVNLQEIFAGRPENIFLQLEVKTTQADFAPTFYLAEKIQGEIAHYLGFRQEKSQIKLNLAPFILPSPRDYQKGAFISFYQSNGENWYFLKSWQKILTDFENRKKIIPQENFGGKLSANLQLKGKASDLSGRLEGEVNQGYFRNYSFDALNFTLTLKSKTIFLERAILKKESGEIKASGRIAENGYLDLHLMAQNMPLDIFKLLRDKDFQGRFNLRASFSGKPEDLAFSLSFNSQNIIVAGIPFDQVRLALSKKGGEIFLHDCFFQEGKIISTAKGLFSFSPDGKIDLYLELAGNTPGLLNLFTEECKWLKGNSQIKIKVTGFMGNPQISGYLSFQNTSLEIKLLNSPIKNIEGKGEIMDNLLQITQLRGIWFGERTKFTKNPLGLSGNIDLTKIFKKGSLNFNLIFSPTVLTVDYPNFYSGNLKIQRLTLEGPLDLELRQGPTLKGMIDCEDALINLPKAGTQKTTFPLHFQLLASLRKNVYAVWGEVATLDLSNIFLNLEVSGEDLEITGNLAEPKMLGSVIIKRGIVNIFNREFSLLDSEGQKNFYPYDPERIKDNLAIFSPAEGILPKLTLTAAVNVENIELDAEGKKIKKKIVILSRLTGIPGTTEKAKGLDIRFASFMEDRSKTPPEIIPVAYGEQEIKVMLLPDFIKTLTGISQDQETKVDPNAIFADYLVSRLQTIVFRRVEREIERILGLESLTLEYNFGKDIRQSLGIKDEEALEEKEERPTWGVGFAKGFFDRLYIDVRYIQEIGEEEAATNKTTFNYQLTYKFHPIWSIIYYREPLRLTELTTGYQKVTLKAKVSF